LTAGQCGLGFWTLGRFPTGLLAMNRSRFGVVCMALAVCALPILLGGDTSAAAGKSPHVYLVRGFLGLSTGLDVLAEKMNRRGIHATVHGIGATGLLASEVEANYKSGREGPIVLIGHSMGGSAILAMAEQLGQAGVPVALLVTIDPAAANQVSSNVRRAVNLYRSGGVGTTVKGGANFKGQLENFDFGNRPEMGHFAIQSSDAVHQQVIGYVLQAIR
jgi:pimeloyl-ACP methyl ester carboxylesterase